MQAVATFRDRTALGPLVAVAAAHEDLALIERLYPMLLAESEHLTHFGVLGLTWSTSTQRWLAEGALAHSPAGLTVAVTGVAGPGGGSAEKPVGLVHFGCAMAGGETVHRREIFPGDRSAVREATVRTALEMLLARL